MPPAVTVQDPDGNLIELMTGGATKPALRRYTELPIYLFDA
jgi:hypothetical protein